MEHVRIVGGRQHRVDRDRHDSGFDRAEKSRWKIDAVLNAEEYSLLQCQTKALEGIGEAIDARREISVGVCAGVVDVRNLGFAARSKVAIQQVVSGVEALRNSQRRRARRGVYLTEIHETPSSSLLPRDHRPRPRCAL